MTIELSLRSALTEYFEARKKDGILLEDAIDEVERITLDSINQQCDDAPIHI